IQFRPRDAVARAGIWGGAAFARGKRVLSTWRDFMADARVVLRVVVLIRLTRFGRQRLLGETESRFFLLSTPARAFSPAVARGARRLPASGDHPPVRQGACAQRAPCNPMRIDKWFFARRACAHASGHAPGAPRESAAPASRAACIRPFFFSAATDPFRVAQ